MAIRVAPLDENLDFPEPVRQRQVEQLSKTFANKEDLDVLNGYAAKAVGSPRLETPYSPARAMPNKPAITFGGSGNLSNRTLIPLLRAVRATLTNGSANVVAVEGTTFTASDVGKRVTSGSGAFPSGNVTITAITDSTHATLSAPATNNTTTHLHFGELSPDFTLLSYSKVGHSTANGVPGTFASLVNDTTNVFIPAAAAISHEVRNVSEVSFYCFSHPTAERQIRVMIDTGFGFESASTEPITLTKTASPVLVTLGFGTKIPYAKVRWEYASLDTGVQGVYLLTAEAAGKAGKEILPKNPAIKSAWLGDSYLETGYGGPTGTLNAWSAPSAIASKLLGYTHCFNRGQGGTGWLNEGKVVRAVNSRARDRIDEIASLAPDVLVIALGENDGSSTETAINAEVTHVLGRLRTILPSTRVYLVGAWGSTSLPSAGLEGVNAGIRSAAAAGGVPFMDPLTGRVYDQDGVTAIDSGPWLTPSDFVPDGIHVTTAASTKLGNNVATAIAKLSQIR